MCKPDTTHLDILTPALLLEIANEARDMFEWLDSVPTTVHQPYDGTAEEIAELLEELVRVCAPELVTQLASHVDGDDTRPQWQIRHEQQHTPNEYDADEPIAHLVQAVDKLADIPGTPVYTNMIGIAEAALARAADWARASGDEDLKRSTLNVQGLVEELLEQQD